MNQTTIYKLEEIIEMLNPHCNSYLPLTKSSLKSLKINGLHNFHEFISKPLKTITKIEIMRPTCPVTKLYSCSMARYPYKKAMSEYIAQWGYIFENPLEIPPSLFEATANYLEHSQENTIH